MYITRNWAALLLLGLCGLCAVSHGDGIYFPPAVVEEMPRMPRQQALLIWENGTEQLVVESDVEGAGKTLAWIVPVPAEPTKLEPVSPGVFTTLRWGVRPRPVNGPSWILPVGIFCLIWCLFLLALNRFAPGPSMAFTLAYVLVLGIGIAFWQARSKFSGQAAGPEAVGGSTGVEVLRAEPVGNYAVEVLRAKDAGALRDWLKQDGFRDLPPRGEEIAAQYIAEGWVFVAAKLRRQAEGYARPHPLSIIFPAQKPVYPMRLTQLANTDLQLDLYVIAQERADAPGMNTIFCDKYHREQRNGENPRWHGKEVAWPAFGGQSLGLPWLVEHMGPQCVLTQLRAHVKNRSMSHDIALGFKPFAPERQSVYLPSSIYYAVIERGMLAFSLVFGLGLLVHYWRLHKNRRSWGWAKPALVACCIAAPVASWPWFTLPRAALLSGAFEWEREPAVASTVRALRAHPEVLRTMSHKEIVSYFEEALAHTINPYTGENLQTGQAPGQYEIIEAGKGIAVRYYEARAHDMPIGTPVDTELKDANGEAKKEDRSDLLLR